MDSRKNMMYWKQTECVRGGVFTSFLPPDSRRGETLKELYRERSSKRKGKLQYCDKVPRKIRQ
jgi:hypothetical protein